MVAAWRSRARWTRADRFFIVWAAMVVVFFSSSQSKRPGYVLPGVIALAVLVARLFDRALARPDGRAARLILRGTVGVAILSAAAAGALSLNLGGPDRLQALLDFESNEFSRLQPDVGIFVAALVAVAVVALGARLWRDVRLALAVFVLPAVLFLSVGFGTARALRGGELVARARAGDLPLPPDSRVACLECFAVGLPFYVGQPVVYITERGRGGLTSNYVRYRLERDANWPPVLVRLDDRTRWLESQTVPVYVLARDHSRPRARGHRPRPRHARGGAPTGVVGRARAAAGPALTCAASAGSRPPVEGSTARGPATTSARWSTRSRIADRTTRASTGRAPRSSGPRGSRSAAWPMAGSRWSTPRAGSWSSAMARSTTTRASGPGWSRAGARSNRPRTSRSSPGSTWSSVTASSTGSRALRHCDLGPSSGPAGPGSRPGR